MARLQQAKELLANFRMRLGEPTVGTFGTIRYDEINAQVHEVLEIFNQAQDYVTWICYSANLSLLETSVELLVEPSVTRILLPEDFIGEVSVFHRIGGQEYPVEPENLTEIRRSTRVKQNDYRFRFYEIRENAPQVSARGIIHTESDNVITAGGSAGSLNNIRVGDIVYNLTDRSESVVERLNYNDSPDVQSVNVEPLDFGIANRFNVGDRFQIDMKEQTRDAIDLYPELPRAGVKTFYSGSGDSFRLTEDNVIVETASVTPSGIPSNFEADERVVLRVTDDSTGEVVAYGSRVGLSNGANSFFFSRTIQMREDREYSAIIRREVDAGFMADINVSKIELLGRDVNNYIDFKYSKLPRKITSLEDYCEMPSWSMEAVYAYGQIIAFKKMTRGQVADPGLVNDFNSKVAEIENYRYKRDERGPHSMLDGFGQGVSGSPFPGNYAIGYVDPFDIL